MDTINNLSGVTAQKVEGGGFDVTIPNLGLDDLSIQVYKLEHPYPTDGDIQALIDVLHDCIYAMQSEK